MILGKTIKISKRSDGFTLVEALLSVAILGLLAATMGTVYSSANQALAVQADHILFDSALRSRMEFLIGTPFDTLVTLDGSFQNITINGTSYQIVTTVALIDLDGDSNTEATARRVTVSLSAGVSGGSGGNFNLPVSNNGDDAEEQLSGGMVLANGELRLGQMKYVGVRFLNVTIPQSANVIDAYVEFRSNTDKTENTSLEIRGEDTDDSPGFGTGDNYFTNIVKTTAFVPWDPVPNWTTGQLYQSPSITTIIQEIVNRSGWSSGNAMTLLFESTDPGGNRLAYSHDDTPGYAPSLHVEYSVGGSPGPAFRSLTTIIVDNEGGVGKIS